MAAGRAADEAPDLDGTDPLTIRLREGLRLNAVARFTESQACLDAALALADGLQGHQRDYWRARLLITRAYPTMELVGEAEALGDLRRARELARKVGSARLVTLSHIQDSNVHFRATRWRDAVRSANAAERSGGRLTEEESYALLLNRGFARLALHRLDEAEQDLRRAHDVARSTGSPVLLFKVVHNLGCLEWLRGNLPRALAVMDEADGIPADIPRDRAWLDQAQVLIEAGLVDRARGRLREALATAREARHRLDEGAIHLDLARCAIHDGNLELARAEAQEAIAQFTAGGATHRVHRAELTVATVDLVAGVAPEATEAIARTWLTLGGDPAEDRIATRLLAEALLARGAVQECAELLGDTGPAVGFGAAAELHEYLVLVQLAQARGQGREVSRLLRAAARRLAIQQLQAQSLELRVAVALHGGRLAAFDVSHALASGSPERIFTSVERWRSASHRLSPLEPPTDPVIARLLVTLRHTRHHASESGADVRDEVHRLENAVTRRELSRPHRQTDAAVGTPASLARVRDAVRATGSTLAQLFVSDGVVHVVVVGADRTRARALGSLTEVEPLARRLADDLRARALAGEEGALAVAVTAALADSLREVDDVLGRTVLELLPPSDDPIVLVPTGALAGVAWSLLPSWRGRPVLLSPSATRWVHLIEGARPVRRDSPAASGRSASSGGPGAATRTRELRVRALAGPGLPLAIPETEQVVAAWAASPWVSSARSGTRDREAPATTAAVRRALARAEVVHIAAHGSHEDQNPLFDSLRLADGPLFIHEFPANAAAQHVVLSACDVGRARVRPGDEPLGFAAALLARGIPSVVAAIAPVPDDAAASAMVSYHRALATGTPASRALAAAIEEVPRAGAFCLFGADWAAPGPRLE